MHDTTALLIKSNQPSFTIPSHVNCHSPATYSHCLATAVCPCACPRALTATRQPPPRQPPRRQPPTNPWHQQQQQVLQPWQSASVTHLPGGLMADHNGGVGAAADQLNGPHRLSAGDAHLLCMAAAYGELPLCSALNSTAGQQAPCCVVLCAACSDVATDSNSKQPHLPFAC